MSTDLGSLGAIRIDLQAFTAKFDAALTASNKRLDSVDTRMKKLQATTTRVANAMGKAFGALKVSLAPIIGIFAGVQFARSLGGVADAVDEIGVKAKALGTPVEQLSGLAHAMKLANVESATLYGMLGKLAKNVGDVASDGAGPAAEAFKKLRISVRGSSGEVRSITELFPEIIRAFERLGSQEEKLDLASKLFGREGGAEFVQFLEDSGDALGNISTQMARAREFGAIVTEAEVQRIGAFNDALDNLSAAWFGFKKSILSNLAPALTRYTKNLTDLIVVARDIAQKIANAIAVAWEGLFGSDGRAQDIIRSFVASVWRWVKIQVSDLFDWISRGFRDLMLDLAEFAAGVLKLSNLPFSGRLADGLAAAVAQARLLAQIQDMMPKAPRSSGVGFWWGEMQKLGAEFNQVGDAAENAGKKINKALGPPQLDKVKTFSDGVAEGFKKAYEAAHDFAALGEDVTRSLIDGLGNGLASALAKGEMGFKNLGQTALSVLNDVLETTNEIVLKFLLTQAITGGLNSAFPTTFPLPGKAAANGAVLQSGKMTGKAAANGAVLQSGKMTAFAAGGIATGPTVFPLGDGGMGLMGEAGDEGILPLAKVDGKLGVHATGGGTIVQVIDQRSGGAKPEVQRTRGPDGRELIRVIVRDELGNLIGNGGMDRAMSQAYGVRRVGRTR